jgi:hypothetical protein
LRQTGLLRLEACRPPGMGTEARPIRRYRLAYSCAMREGDTLVVTKLDRLARSTSDLYRIVSSLTERGIAFKVVDDPTIDTTSRTGNWSWASLR